MLWLGPGRAGGRLLLRWARGGAPAAAPRRGAEVLVGGEGGGECGGKRGWAGRPAARSPRGPPVPSWVAVSRGAGGRQRVRKEAAAFRKWSQPWKAAPERPEPGLQSTRAGGRGGCGRVLPPGLVVLGEVLPAEGLLSCKRIGAAIPEHFWSVNWEFVLPTCN